MKKAKSIQTSLSCKATASLSAEVSEDLEKKDKPLESILNEKENRNTSNSGCCKNSDCRRTDSF